MFMAEYMEYMKRKAKGKARAGPSEQVIAVWKLHVLDKIGYKAYCDAVLGKYIEYDVKSLVSRRRRPEGGREQKKRKRSRQFCSNNDADEVWDALSKSSRARNRRARHTGITKKTSTSHKPTKSTSNGKNMLETDDRQLETKYRGLKFQYSKWVPRFSVGGRSFYFGSFEDAKVAASAYNIAARALRPDLLLHEVPKDLPGDASEADRKMWAKLNQKIAKVAKATKLGQCRKPLI